MTGGMFTELAKLEAMPELLTDWPTPAEAAEAMHTSPATIYRRIHAGELEAVRLGDRGPIRIRPESLEALIRPVAARGEEA